MRRIEFIAPVDAMRGNLSGNQDLKYAENMNPAFDAPEGRQYAKNYQPRYIGAKRAATGLKYFNAKTKSATNISQASLLNMALLGGTQAVYAAIIHNSEFYSDVQDCYAWWIQHGVTKSLRLWILDKVRSALKLHASTIVFTGGTGTTSTVAANPWNPVSSATELDINPDLIVKFFPQLGYPNSPMFTLANQYKGVAQPTMPWASLASSALNVLGITIDTSSTPNKVMFGAYTIAEGTTAVSSTATITSKNYDLI